MYCEKKSSYKIKNRKDLFVWGFVLVVMAAIAVGSAGQGPIGAGANESIGRADVGVIAGGKIQSISFKKDMRVQDALRFLGGRYQKNIVPSPRVDGVLGFTSLFDVTFEEAMDAILGTNFKYEQSSNVIKVYSKEEYKKFKEDESRMIHKVFTLYYITAEEASKLIKPVLSGAGQVQASTAAETEISGGGGSGSSGGSSLSGGGGGDSLALHDTLIVYDYPENIAKAEEVIVALDIRPKQVLVEATILSVLLTEGMSLGVDLNLLGGVSLTGAEAQTGDEYNTAVVKQTVLEQIAAGVAGTALETAGFATVGGSGLRIGVRSGNVTAFITALESITDVTVLANPKILALNKQEGSVLIGTKTGYDSQTTVSEGGTATTKVEFLKTGTQLVFRPYIGNDGYIRMDIYPKDSSLTPGKEPPEEVTAELKTNIIVRDGETIVIGGLFRDYVRTIRSQIPLLGDLPLVGAAFRSTADTVQRQEVIILLTPHIIDAADQTDGEARVADIGRKRYGARMALQWAGRARLAEDRYTEAVKYYLDGDSQAALDKVSSVLELRPTYLEALRLKERIISETAPDDVATIERVMLDVIEREEANKWLRR